jgi:Phage integrase family
LSVATLKKEHRKAITDSKVRPFVLYTLRHTFLTRLGASGCDLWTLARIAGHSSLVISYRYVHPSEDRVLDAMAILDGHKTGHNDKEEVQQENKQLAQTTEVIEGYWWAVQDSNLRPPACKAGALTS